MTTGMSLGEFDRRYGINKGTVKRDAEANGYSTSEGLTGDAVDFLLSYYKGNGKIKSETPQQPTATESELVVVDGTFEGKETPQIQPYRMQAPDVLALTLSDPLSLARQFETMGDGIKAQLEAQQAELRKREEDTALAVHLVERKTREVAAAQRKAEIDGAVTSAFIRRDAERLQSMTGVE
jgi:hypothetical protein